MEPATLTALIAAAVAIVSGALTYRASSQANRISAVKVDAEAYDRAQKIYQGGLELQERQVAALRDQVDRLERQVEEERQVSDRLRRQVRELRNMVARMEHHISLMRARMQAAGIAVPEPPRHDEETEDEPDREATA